MSRSGTYTLKGTIPDGTNFSDGIRLVCDNGNINENFRVTKFEIFPNMNRTNNGTWTDTVLGAQHYLTVILALDEDGVTGGHGTFDDNRQIGHAVAYGTKEPDHLLISLDPDHIVVMDLWLGAYTVDRQDGSTGLTSVPINYRIELEKITTSDAQAVLALIKERSQTDVS